MREEWAQVYLGFGSSLNPEKNIRAGLSSLRHSSHVELRGISTFYRTPPLPAPGASPASVAGDPDFLNGAVGIRTDMAPEELATLLSLIEDEAGRLRTENSYAPRTLDVDVLIYLPEGSHPTPSLPPPSAHPDILTRAWVALPLFELNPGLHLPPEGTPLAQVVKQFQGTGGTPEPEFTQELRAQFLRGSFPES